MTYGNSIRINRSLANEKYKFLNYKVYRGLGRPRKEDYEYVTIMDMVDRAKKRMETAMGEVINKPLFYPDIERR